MRPRPPDDFAASDWEAYVQRTARRFAYPPTPALAIAPTVRGGMAARGSLWRWRAAWAALAALLVLAALLAVPEVRAALREVLRLGGITIVRDESMPPPLTLPDGSALQLAGETTLEAARDSVAFAIALPTYPPDLGAPDRVVVQPLAGPVVILLWTAPDDPSRPRLALHILGPEARGWKRGAVAVEQVMVNGREAWWVTGTHQLEYLDPAQPASQPESTMTLLVEGPVLIWERDGLTYRLESGLPPAEAIRIAESIE
jgi:hypothetical protein